MSIVPAMGMQRALDNPIRSSGAVFSVFLARWVSRTG